MKHIPLIVGVALLAAACSNEAAKPEPHVHDASHPHEATKAADKTPAGMKETTPSADYPLKTCVVSGEDLGAMGERIAYTYDVTEVQFCCPDCLEKFGKDPQPYLAKVRAAKK